MCRPEARHPTGSPPPPYPLPPPKRVSRCLDRGRGGGPPPPGPPHRRPSGAPAADASRASAHAQLARGALFCVYVACGSCSVRSWRRGGPLIHAGAADGGSGGEDACRRARGRSSAARRDGVLIWLDWPRAPSAHRLGCTRAVLRVWGQRGARDLRAAADGGEGGVGSEQHAGPGTPKIDSFVT